MALLTQMMAFTEKTTVVHIAALRGQFASARGLSGSVVWVSQTAPLASL